MTMSNRRLGRHLFSQEVWQYLGRDLGLSAKELRIAQSIFDNQHESMIAEEMEISPHTVHTHFERLYRKLHVGSRVELVILITGAYLQACQETGSPAEPLCSHLAAGECPLRG